MDERSLLGALGTIHKGRPHRGGGGPKSDIVRRLRDFSSLRVDLAKNEDKGEGSKI